MQDKYLKRHRGRSSNYFTCNPCGAPAKFGGDWRSPYVKYLYDFFLKVLSQQTSLRETKDNI
jgi:hypothetical protein